MKRVIRIIAIIWMAVSAISIAVALITTCIDIDHIISNPALLELNLSSNEFYDTLTGFILFYSIIIFLYIIGIVFLIGMIIITAKDQLNKL
jgi:hypothetical protein